MVPLEGVIVMPGPVTVTEVEAGPLSEAEVALIVV